MPPKAKMLVNEEVTEAEWAFYNDAQHWRRSKRGNLWREWYDKRLTLYRRRDGLWGWCYEDAWEGARFSNKGYRSFRDAKLALGDAIGVGY